MKKLFVILIVLVFLVGCVPTKEMESTPKETTATLPIEQPTIPTSMPSIAEPEVVTEPEPEVLQQPMIAVSLPLNTDSTTNESGLPIFNNRSQSIQLTIRDPEVANSITLDFLNRIDQHSSAIDTLRQAAEGADSAVPNWSAYIYDIIYQPMRLDHTVLSLYGETIVYDGENRPQRMCMAVNYNTITGDTLTLGSILYHIDAKDDLAELTIESLDAIAEEKYLWDGYDDVVRKRFNRDESFDEDWYFTTEGLCFYFTPYEIAPYTSGVVVAQIPYEKLSGILADAFFPAEEDLCEGTILSIGFDSPETDNFSQITEITIDPDGEMFFLYTDKSVRNLQINKEFTDFGFDGNSQMSTIFRTYTLTPGDAIAIKISPERLSDNIVITYESSGELQSITLSPAFFEENKA